MTTAMNALPTGLGCIIHYQVHLPMYTRGAIFVYQGRMMTEFIQSLFVFVCERPLCGWVLAVFLAWRVSPLSLALYSGRTVWCNWGLGCKSMRQLSDSFNNDLL